MSTPLPNAASVLIMMLLLAPPVLGLPSSGSDPQNHPPEHETSSFSCFRATDPDIRNVDQLYDANIDKGALWSREGEPPPCFSVSRPPPGRCVVCSQFIIHAVCDELLRNVTLVMEEEGRTINITKSPCPSLQSEGTERSAVAGNHAGGPHRCFPILFSLLLVIITAEWLS